MPFNSVTRLRLRKFATLWPFVSETEKIVAQLAPSAGFLGGAVLVEGRLVAWIRSAWESEAAMKGFRDTEAHRASMPKLVDWCDEACVAHWEGEVVTDWDEIHARMARELRLSKVRRPTKAHTEKRIAPLKRWMPERIITPTRRAS